MRRMAPLQHNSILKASCRLDFRKHNGQMLTLIITQTLFHFLVKRILTLWKENTDWEFLFMNINIAIELPPSQQIQQSSLKDAPHYVRWLYKVFIIGQFTGLNIMQLHCSIYKSLQEIQVHYQEQNLYVELLMFRQNICFVTSVFITSSTILITKTSLLWPQPSSQIMCLSAQLWLLLLPITLTPYIPKSLIWHNGPQAGIMALIESFYADQKTAFSSFHRQLLESQLKSSRLQQMMFTPSWGSRQKALDLIPAYELAWLSPALFMQLISAFLN
jgi:hypothetical protein